MVLGHRSFAAVLSVVAISACASPDYGSGVRTSVSPTEVDSDAGTATSTEKESEATLSGTADFPSSSRCASCHPTIAAQWATSMHARSTSSLVTIAETNQVVAGRLLGTDSPGRASFCVNCHAPIRATVANEGTLPFATNAVPDEGVSCGACHQFGRTPTSGAAGAADFGAALTRGTTLYGPFADAATNSAHASERRDSFGDTGALCGSCHDVNLDRDGDARIHKVNDLVLQTTQDEYDAYRQTASAPKTCAECHMPVMASVRRAADGVADAPTREVHDHSFVGVDYPLDGTADTQLAARKAMLGQAATLAISAGALAGGAASLDVSITNSGTGHSLPTGFAFARQMWVELVVKDADGNVAFSSGSIAKESQDLCDADVLGSPLATRVEGCATPDPQLVDFQLKLVDGITATTTASGDAVRDTAGELVARATDTAQEVVLQHATGGAVPRLRSVDGVQMGAIPPGVTRSFGYTFTIPPAARRPLRVTARLLFRNLPPYFLRALLAGDPTASAIVERLKVIEMGTATVDFAPGG